MTIKCTNSNFYYGQIRFYRPIQIGNAIINSFQGGQKQNHDPSHQQLKTNQEPFTGDVDFHSPEEWTHQGRFLTYIVTFFRYQLT